MKILIPTTAIPGHLNPLLGLARILVKHGHEVLLQTGNTFKPLVEAAGISFMPLLPEADVEVTQFFAKHPEVHEKEPLERTRFGLENLFLAQLPAQAAGLEMALHDFPADVILTESMFYGTLPLLLGRRQNRATIVHAGITVLDLFSGKAVPPAVRASAEELEVARGERERVILRPLQAAFDKTLATLGCGPLPCPVLECMSTLPDLYLHPGIQSLQYPGHSVSSAKVRYIGYIPPTPGQHPLPDWWQKLDKTKRLVLVTQGTVANWNLGQLIGPTLRGLSEERDLLVLATTGGKPAEAIPVDVPANARIASFLPYEQVLPRIDLLITNGGYGTVNMALAQGVPIVCAGLTEDKEEVSANLQWSGGGIDLRTNEPAPEAIRTAARKVLDSSVYRDRAKELAQEFASHDTEAQLLALLQACVEPPVNVLST
jgi:UDP:flavonoid glycosyltransferase YjiC (YdhE family)